MCPSGWHDPRGAGRSVLRNQSDFLLQKEREENFFFYF
jgi:hypothetical protein